MSDKEDLILSKMEEINQAYHKWDKERTEEAKELWYKAVRRFSKNELALIKGVGNNSSEMKKLQEENKKLKEDLIREKEEHQYDNNVHRKEIKELKGRINGSFNRN